MGLRLGLDLGTNSIGWALLRTDSDIPTAIQLTGVRIFSDGRDPQKGDPLAVERRLARGARVRRDRLLRRKDDLRKTLMKFGLFPTDNGEQEKLKLLNPYELRVRALTEELTPHELGRALIHLSQRRGFASNRKGDKKDDKEEKKDREALDKALKENGLTLGEYLYRRLQEGKGARARPGEGLTTLRDHYKNEFTRIRESQKPHHTLSDSDWDKIEDILFFQRPLKPAQRGLCQIYFGDKEERAYRAMPSFQRFRIEQNLVNLQIIGADRKKISLDKEQRTKLREKLLSQKTMSFGKIRTLLGLDDSYIFNLESDRRNDMEGDTTSALLSKKEYFGTIWSSFGLEKKDNIVALLLEEGKPEAIKETAVKEWGLSGEQGQALANLSDTKFEPGTARFSTRALYELIPILENQGLSVTEAIAQIRGGYGHNRRGESLLKYYGEILPDSVVPQRRASVEDEKIYGKINNPTVHIGLNQMRKLINEIISEHGLPDEMIVELSRSLKLTRDAKKALNEQQKKNETLNKEAKEKIEGQGFSANAENLLRYKLWKELNSGDINDHKSPYSGRNISISQLFSNQIEIEHILPLSRTLDDSYNNKTICFVDENRMKGNFSPYEACQKKVFPFNHDEILDRVSCLPRKKRYRFEADAMERWEKTEGGFIARQLTDTQYLSKVAKRYLESLYPDDGKIHVRVIPGQLTAKLRHQWGLNSILSGEGSDEKNRNDHRHHAIDAVVIGCTDQRLMQRAAEAAEELQELEFDPPFGTIEEYRNQVKEKIDPVIVSHRQDHGWQGAMHEGTNYGIIKNPDKYETDNNYNVVYRKPFISLFAGLEPEKAKEKALEIRDARLRAPLIKLFENAFSKEDVARIVENFAKEKGIRNIRILKKEATIIAIEHPKGKKFKKGVAPGKIHSVGFWRMPSGEIEAVGRSVFEVNRAKGDMNKLKPHPAAKLKMTLHKKDMVRVVKSDQGMTCIVVSMSPENGNFKLRPQNLGKSEEFKISFNQVKKYQVRKIFISPSGKIHDPGPIF